MRFRPRTIPSRRSRNAFTISPTSGGRDVSAAIPARWVNAAVHETEFVTSFVTGSTSGHGNTPYPSRHPVIANVLLKPSRRMVRSAIPSSRRMEWWAPSYKSSVDLVRQHPEVARSRDVGDVPQDALREDAAGRVLGAVEDDELRAVGDEGLELVDVRVEVVLLAQSERHAHGAGEADHRRVAGEARAGVDGLVARVEEREHRVEHDRFRSGRDDDLPGIDAQA